MEKNEQQTQVLVRMSDDLRRRIDAWRKRQEDLPSRPEAIRRILESALRKG